MPKWPSPRQALGLLKSPVHAIPGNHDVGDEPPGQEADQIIDAHRLQRWLSVFGADRFAFDAGGWRVLGINAQLLGSGLPQEGEQDAWLDAELGAASRPVLLALHKPLFLQSADEAEVTATSVNPEPRARLLRRLRRRTGTGRRQRPLALPSRRRPRRLASCLGAVDGLPGA